MVDYGIVPPGQPLVDQGADGGGAEGLGHRADLEEGVRVDWIVAADLLDAEALGEDDLALVDDGDRQAGDVPVGEGLGDVGGQAGEGGGGRGLCGRLRFVRVRVR